MSTAPLLFADRALSVRLEAVEMAQDLTIFDVHAARLPHRPVASIARAGGCAAFFGRSMSSLSRVLGLGMNGPVEADDIDAIEDFYRTRGMPVRVLVSPYADPSLFAQLAGHGFRLVELDTMLVRRIDPDEPLARPREPMSVRVARPDERSVWVRSSLESFAESAEPLDPEQVESFEAAFDAQGTTYFFAELGGSIAGTGGVYVHRAPGAGAASAYLFATSVPVAQRGRGAQGALIDARLVLAQAAGCDLAFSRTMPGSASQRNFERRGFRPVYSRALLEKRFE